MYNFESHCIHQLCCFLFPVCIRVPLLAPLCVLHPDRAQTSHLQHLINEGSMMNHFLVVPRWREREISLLALRGTIWSEWHRPRLCWVLLWLTEASGVFWAIKTHTCIYLPSLFYICFLTPPLKLCLSRANANSNRLPYKRNNIPFFSFFFFWLFLFWNPRLRKPFLWNSDTVRLHLPWNWEIFFLQLGMKMRQFSDCVGRDASFDRNVGIS